MGTASIQAVKKSLKIILGKLSKSHNLTQGRFRLATCSCVACLRVLLQNLLFPPRPSCSWFLLQVFWISLISEAKTIRLYGVNLPNRRQSEIWKGVPTISDYSNLLRKTLQVAKTVQKIQTKCSRKLTLRDTMPMEPTFWLTPWAPTLYLQVPVVLYFQTPLSYSLAISPSCFMTMRTWKYYKRFMNNIDM